MKQRRVPKESVKLYREAPKKVSKYVKESYEILVNTNNITLLHGVF